jgi:hypothetical protein
MSRNGSGTYSVPNSFSSGTTIASADVNTNFSDVGSEITNSLPRDGQAAMTGQLKAASGTAAVPGMAFGADTDTGFFRKDANTIGVSAGGVEVGTIGATGFSSFPSGTVLAGFVQTAAPTGWTKSITHNNKALRIVSGTVSTGGTTDFTSVFTSRTIATTNLPAHTHGAGTLSGTADSGGAHTHTTGLASSSDVATTGGGARITGAGAATFPETSSSGAHTHTVSINSGATGSTGSGTAMDFAVAYVDVIICIKD